MAKMLIYGAILAGGRSSRFGGQDKGLIPFQQKPMIESVINRLRPQVDRLIISANANIDTYEQYGYPVVPDCTTGFQGPLVGIYSIMNFINSTLALPTADAGAMKNSEKSTTENIKQNNSMDINLLIVPCDMPLLPSDLTKKLLNAKTRHQQTSSVVRENNRLQPLLALLPLSSITQLEQYIQSGAHKVEKWILSGKPAICDFTSQSDCFKNINSALELGQAEKNANH
ncbi:MAG: molybdenum cofactor guanylyltransferase [Gammaproteobacteria bacterium]|nr:molybdenum cofactor guanylyltransferase [Gammaproteobacteria bacterium]